MEELIALESFERNFTRLLQSKLRIRNISIALADAYYTFKVAVQKCDVNEEITTFEIFKMFVERLVVIDSTHPLWQSTLTSYRLLERAIHDMIVIDEVGDVTLDEEVMYRSLSENCTENTT